MMTIGLSFSLIALLGIGSPNHSRRDSVQIDSSALRLLDDVARSFRSANTLHASTQTILTKHIGNAARTTQTTTRQEIRYLRPGFIRVDAYDPGYQSPNYSRAARTITTVCTPTSGVEYDNHDHTLTTYDGPGLRSCEDARQNDLSLYHFFDTTTTQRLSYGHGAVASLWDSQHRILSPQVQLLRREGHEMWNGESHDIVEIRFVPAYVAPGSIYSGMYTTTNMRLYIDSAHRLRRVITTDATGSTTDAQILSIRTDEPLRESDFTFTAPAGTTTKAMPAGTFLANERRRVQSVMGKQFPTLDIEAPLLDGRRATLRQLLQQKKGAVLWYWSTDCSGCIATFPAMEQLYRLTKDRGLDVIALDPISLDTHQDSLATHYPVEERAAHRMQDKWGTTLPIVLSRPVTDGLLNAMLDLVVVDSTGTVVYAGGAGTHEMRLVLESLLGDALIPGEARLQ